MEIYYVKCKKCATSVEIDRKPRGQNIATAFSAKWKQTLACPACGAKHHYTYQDVKKSGTELST